MVRFMKYYVTDGKHKAKVHYSDSRLIDGRTCVTLYAKEYTNDLHKIFDGGYENRTDTMTDYFEKGRVRIFPDNKHYAAALSRCRKE